MKKQLSTILKPGSPVRKPHKYQRRGVEWLVQLGGAGIFAAPGAGKTAVTLRAFKALLDAKVARRMLVVATLRVSYKVWPVESAEWAGSAWDCLRQLRVCVLHGPRKDYLLGEDADVYVVNFDGLKWLLEEHAEEFAALNIDTLVIDESTKVKHTNTKRFKLLKPYLDSFARRWILTGKPIPRSYLDLFGQIYVIDGGRALGRFVTHYRQQFFFPVDKMGWEWKLKEGAEELIQRAIAPYIFQLAPGDYKEIPIVENVIRIDLPAKARKIYDEMEEELIVQLDNRAIIAASAGVAAGKCAQIANGGLYHHQTEEADWGRRTWVDIHEAKTEAVVELVEELQGAPCLIVYDYKHDLARLKRALGNPPHVGGGVSPKESDRIIDGWNRDEFPVVLVHGQSVAHGLNLQYGTARNIIWHSITYDREIYDQLNMRLARQGSKHASIFVHFIVAVNTVDVPKMRALKSKGRVQDEFLAALKNYAEERR
jgi:SNF2 family DNA or RNA helicase